MPTNPVLVPTSLVSQFLATEKIATRRWLQSQMEPLLDQVFDQLSTKFEDYVASRGIFGTGDYHQMDHYGIGHRHEHSFQFPATTNPNLINTEFTISGGQNPDHRDDAHFMSGVDVKMNGDGINNEHEGFSFDQTNCELINTTNQSQCPPSTSNLDQSNQNGLDGNDDDQPPNADHGYKLLDQQTNEPITTPNQSKEDSGVQKIKQEFDESETGEMSQSGASLNSLKSNPNIKMEFEDDNDDCDCDECLGGIEVKQKYDNDSVERTEDFEISRPRKKPRLDTTEPNNHQSLRLVKYRNQTLNHEVTNKQDSQILTISLQCLQTDCPLKFTNKDQLTSHLITQHNIQLYRCLVKDCKQSFSNNKQLGKHNKEHHPITEWHCAKCGKHYPTSHQLYCHNYSFHQLGLFQCPFPNCAFTAEYRQKVYNHNKSQHKPELICQHDGCGRRFNSASSLRLHQRAHLGFKPYRCKWPDCGYTSTHLSNTIGHIKRNHLTGDDDEMLLFDPKQYVELIR